MFDRANQVELVDIEPADLIARLQAGKVYKSDQAQRALGHFFSLENLAALREIALRRTADRLNRSAQKAGNEAAARAGEHILICLSSSPSNPKVIRTAARMAEAFHSGFTALFAGEMAGVALGNVIGSNIANILLILGLSATIHPLSMGGITVWDLLMVVLSSVLLFLAAFTFKRRAIDRWEGAIFLAIYVAYIGYLIR